ncbi:FAD:protein FMN transferase [Streptococcus halotolerans]|uniref:FAD:protein FMN transferase n=1 Tax=Streptococcus halotolerans TaxID=1814128 RepID=UPI0007899EBB|nr:FAD:protein FMN transferase [Streptococcus halotolerans]
MKRNIRPFLTLFISVLTLLGCQKVVNDKNSLPIVKNPETRTEALLHTVVQLSIYHEHQEKAMDEAIDYIKEMEKLLSTNLEGSDINNINQAAGKKAVKVDPRTFEIIEAAQAMSRESNGKFDISIGAVTNLWRIGDDAARVPSDDEIKKALPYINYKDIQLDKEKKTVYINKGMTLELGAISKGYIADGVKKRFKKRHITTAIINLGGNVLTMGESPKNSKGWNIGVQNPDEVRGETVGSVYVKDSSVVTSGVYERYIEKDGQKYHHIMDPKTGYPVDNDISGVTVFTKTSLQGDELSTSLFLLGIKDGLKLIDSMDGVEAVFIDKENGIHSSNGLKDKLTLRNEDYHLVTEK